MSGPAHTPDSRSKYWDTIAEAWSTNAIGGVWRVHSEALERWPTSYRTGLFVAFLAEKP